MKTDLVKFRIMNSRIFLLTSLCRRNVGKIVGGENVDFMPFSTTATFSTCFRKRLKR